MRNILLASLFGLALFLPGAATAADPISIGVISPLSGPFATVGTRQTAAIQWWADEVNAKGGINGRKIELAVCDDRGNPEVAVTCARNHIQNGVSLLLDTSVAGTIRAVMPLLNNGPVMIVASPIINPPANSYVFQTSPTDLEITRGLLLYMQANHQNRLAMIASTDATGEVGVADAQAVFPPAGVKLELTRIDLNSNDASIQLANVLKDNPPLLYSAYSGGGAAAVVKSFTNLGMTMPLVISNANLTESFMALIRNDMPPRLLGLGLNSMVPESVKDPDEKARIEHFEKAYEAARKEPVDLLSTLGLMLADTADAVVRNVADPKNAAATKSFLESARIKSIAPIHFTPSSHVGLSADSVAVLEYKQGHWTEALK
ncbi:MAG TPA: ABC transporter substrate-binding protein [Xanthobacteraceae bacterium]|nr:ABC transporter substrate-binding protein [Xanthobacteraceae bacterium]